MVEDKNIVLGNSTNISEATADGGGITLLGPTGSDKYIIYNSASGTWQLSESADLSANKVYKINNTEVLSSTSLRSGVTGTSLTSVGTLTNLRTSGNVGIGKVISDTYELDVSGDITASEVTAGGVTLTSRKSFDIPHPTKEGYRLRHTCPEGPSNDVYFRGTVRNKKEILLPNYWKKLVDWTTITVNLTPIGAHQDVIVKRIDAEKVYLQAMGGMPINCFFHIYGTRADGERLIPEYEGETPADYPGNNDEYSVSGYHYDKRG